MFVQTQRRSDRFARRLSLVLVLMGLVAGMGMAQEKPLTLPALQCMPKQTALAVGIPPLNRLVEVLVPIVDKVAPELDAAGAIEDFVTDFSIDFGLDAENLEELGKEMGLDLNAPVAVFVDVSPTMKSVETIKEKLGENPTPEQVEDALESMIEIPAITGVISVTDAALAETTLQDLGAMIADFDPDAFEKVTAGDVTVKSLGPEVFNYFIADNKLVLGNSLDMVANTALRLKEPATLRYGGADCPALSPDEISLLLWGSDLLPGIMAVASLLQGDDPATKAIVDKQIEMMKALWEGDGANDPIVVSIAADQNRLEIATRMDSATHPAMITQSGAAQPLKYAPLLNDASQLFLSLVLTDEMKTMISEMVLDTLAAQSSTDPGMAQGLTMGRQVLQMVGPEITIGLSPVADDFPAAVVMIGLKNPEATKGLLQMLIPTMPEETYNDVEISSIVAGIPVPLSIAYPGDMVLLSNNSGEIKRILDLMKAGKTSELFGSLKPALDPATARYAALIFKSALFTDVIQPLAMLAGGIPAEVDTIASQVAAVVDELRVVQEMQGSWVNSSVRLSIK